MRKIQLTEKQTCTLSFTTPSGKPASLHLACNPLTGGWLQMQNVGGIETAYTSDKRAALHLANLIVSKSAELGVDCAVKIEPATTIPQP